MPWCRFPNCPLWSADQRLRPTSLRSAPMKNPLESRSGEASSYRAAVRNRLNSRARHLVVSHHTPEPEDQDRQHKHVSVWVCRRITDLIALTLIVAALLALVIIGNAGAAVITAAGVFVVGHLPGLPEEVALSTQVLTTAWAPGGRGRVASRRCRTP